MKLKRSVVVVVLTPLLSGCESEGERLLRQRESEFAVVSREGIRLRESCQFDEAEAVLYAFQDKLRLANLDYTPLAMRVTRELEAIHEARKAFEALPESEQDARRIEAAQRHDLAPAMVTPSPPRPRSDPPSKSRPTPPRQLDFGARAATSVAMLWWAAPLILAGVLLAGFAQLIVAIRDIAVNSYLVAGSTDAQTCRTKTLGRAAPRYRLIGAVVRVIDFVAVLHVAAGAVCLIGALFPLF